MRGRPQEGSLGACSHKRLFVVGHIRRMPRQSQAAKQRSDMSAWLIAWEGHAWTERRKDDGRGSPPKRKNLPDRGAEKASAGRESPPKRMIFRDRGAEKVSVVCKAPPRWKISYFRGAVQSLLELKLPPETEEFSISGGSVELVPVEATPPEGRILNFGGQCRVCSS